MTKTPLSSVDTAWLHMEDPTNLMMVTGVMTFSAPMDFERLKATLEQRLLARFERFRQRVVEPITPLGAPYWQDDPRFDLNNHLQRITLPAPGDQTALQDVACELASTQLDFSKPLWQFHLVENYGEGSAVISRLHHCIADGIALMHVLLSLTDTEPDAPWPAYQPKKPRRRSWNPLRPLRSAFKVTSRVTETLLYEGMEILDNPSHALDLARMGTDGVAAAGRLVLLWPDPKTIFKGKLGVSKRVAWSEPIPLKDVKTIGRAIGGTVNDILLTAVAGALRRYLQERGQPVDGLNFRAVVPVNLRPLDAEPDLGNKFGLVFLSLPIGIASPVERLLELKRRMDELKGTPEAVVAFGILSAIGLTPQKIQDIVVNIFGAKGTAVMTNVPGPREKLYLAGAPLDSIMFWVPQSGRLGMGMSIMSYAGRVWLGVITDQGLVPDPEAIVVAFQTEFDEVSSLAQRIKETPSKAVKPMLAMLDEAIKTLDEMLEEDSNKSTKIAPDSVPDQCQALTKAGKQCKNRPLPGSNFCRVHG